MNDSLKEHEICHENDLQNGQMREISLKYYEKEYKILLIRQENKYYAIGSKCTHYSLPLVNGILHKDRLRCFAHGACFNIKTGDIEDYPGIDSLPTYKITSRENKIILHATQSQLEQKTRIKEQEIKDLIQIRGSGCCSLTSTRPPKIVIIGNGAASTQCLETLRQHGYSSNITILTRERVPSYDRTKLSKALDVKIEAIQLRSENFLTSSGVHVAYGEQVERIDFKNYFILCETGVKYEYDKLVIASGLESLKYPKTPGDHLKGIFTLRSYEDSREIIEFYQNNKKNDERMNICIIGNSFIAMEIASFFTLKNESIRVLCRRLPFFNQLGPKVSHIIYKFHQTKGVQFKIDDKFKINTFKSDKSDDRVKEIILDSGEQIECDLVIVAIGGKPSTSFLDSSQIQLTSDGFIQVDKYMRTSVDNVYAAGDVTHFPLQCLKVGSQMSTSKESVSIGHWQLSCEQGRCVANSIVGDSYQAFSIVPFFCSVNQGKSIRFAGITHGHDDTLMHVDSSNEFKFVCFYLKNEFVIGVSSLDWDPICAVYAELLNNQIDVHKQHISNDPWNLKTLLK